MSTQLQGIQAVILAAGKGQRIAPFSAKLPKPLLPVVNSTILERQVDLLVRSGVREIAIVIGHLGVEIVRALGDGSRYGATISYVEQQEPLGLAHAVAQAGGFVRGPFFVLLGDIWFSASDLGAMLEPLQQGAEVVLAVTHERDLEAMRKNFAVYEDAQGRVVRVVEKPILPQTTLKGCGLYLFGPDFMETLRRTPRTALRNEYELTEAIQLHIETGHLVRGVEVVTQDLNVTEPRDLLTVNLQALGDRSWIHPEAQVHPEAVIERSVILAGARVESAVRLEECLIFGDAVVSGDAPLRRCIVTAEHVVDCR